MAGGEMGLGEAGVVRGLWRGLGSGTQSSAEGAGSSGWTRVRRRSGVLSSS